MLSVYCIYSVYCMCVCIYTYVYICMLYINILCILFVLSVYYTVCMTEQIFAQDFPTYLCSDMKTQLLCHLVAVEKFMNLLALPYSFIVLL
jgi:hypothetical protein